MAADKHMENILYPCPYNNNGLFSDDEILEADHMNFIAQNLNAIIDILTWKENN
jgi:hypothetical protein